MAKETKIAWATATFTPWRGCVKVSEACRYCYAEGWAKRTGKDIWGPDAKREHASESYWKQPIKWNKEAAASGEPFRVFCSSLSDVCEDRPDLMAPRERLMRLIEATPALIWLLCTKRPENFLRLFPWKEWPKNVWALTTVEDQEQARKRLPHLMKVPAVVRGVSYEPALEYVDFTPWMIKGYCPVHDFESGFCHGPCATDQRLNWLITGGESGFNARRYNVAWAKSVVDACRANGAVPFVKQMGSRPWWKGSDLPWATACMPGRTSAMVLNGEKGWDVDLVSSRRGGKGDDVAEFPLELQVQEFPQG